jgi:hypothetical protein
MDVSGVEKKKSCQVQILRGKMTALVKKLPIEKVGKVSNCEYNCYVNRKCIILAAHPVEKPCGELCGKCGKVRLFHRETGLYQQANRQWLG